MHDRSLWITTLKQVQQITDPWTFEIKCKLNTGYLCYWITQKKNPAGATNISNSKKGSLACIMGHNGLLWITT